MSDEYMVGRIVAYCDMVKRGQKLASTQGIRHEQLAAVTALIASEGCLSRHGQANDTFVHLWIYTDAALEPVLDAITDLPESPLRRFAFGKLCGYADAAVLNFEKRQQSPPAASPGVDPWADVQRFEIWACESDTAPYIEQHPQPHGEYMLSAEVDKALAAERQQHTAQLEAATKTIQGNALTAADALGRVASLTQQLTEAREALTQLRRELSDGQRLMDERDGARLAYRGVAEQLEAAQTQIATLREALRELEGILGNLAEPLNVRIERSYHLVAASLTGDQP